MPKSILRDSIWIRNERIFRLKQSGLCHNPEQISKGDALATNYQRVWD